MDFSSFDLGKVKNMARKGIDRARQIAEGLNELELKVEEATNNDKWGPHGSLMSEITKRSYHGEEYKQILGILARRLHSEPNHWRHIYKSLLLLEYMAKNGPKKIVPELKSNGKVFTRLQKFEYIDSQGKDQGLNVRNRAKQLWDLVHDDDAIARERETAAKNRNKYSGYDRDTAAYAGRSSPAAASSLSAPTGTPAGEAFATVPKRKPGANGAAPAATGAAAVDPVAATEERISKLVVAEEVPAGGDGAPSSGTGGRARKKLSEISADTSIMGSIAAMAQKLPAPAASSSGPASASGAAADTGLNLLDFGDDDDDTPAAPEQPAPVPSEDPLAMLDELAAPPPAAPPAAAASGGGDDWAPFAGAASAAASAGVGDDDWAAFVSSPGAAAVRGAVVAPVAASGAGDWDAFAEPVAVAGGAGAGASAAFADPFAPAVPAAPAGGTGAGVRAPLPMDAFMTPAVEPIPAAPVATHPLQPLTAMGGASDSKAAVPEKDPFADLLG